MDNLQEAMTTTFVDLFPIVMSSEWKTYEEGDAVAFRNKLEAYVSAANLLRETFDKAVWEGHANGSVPVAVESIRAQRTGDKPGRKAQPKTAAEILAARLKK